MDMLIPFICSSVEGRLGCSHFGATMNNAAMSICVNTFSLLLDTHLGVDFLGHMVTLMFNFLKSCQDIFLSSLTILPRGLVCIVFVVLWLKKYSNSCHEEV